MGSAEKRKVRGVAVKKKTNIKRKGSRAKSKRVKKGGGNEKIDRVIRIDIFQPGLIRLLSYRS